MWFLLRKEIGLLEWNLALNLLGDANYMTVRNRISTVLQLLKMFAIKIAVPIVNFKLVYFNFIF